MRPDRIILGELRGDECKTFIDAINTGQSLMARDVDRQVSKLQVRIAVLNGHTASAFPSRKLWNKPPGGKGN